jgi:tryptophanyl-tRNA synthetase
MFKDKTVLTGIKPTGTPHLGNLVGAIQPVIDMSNKATKSYVFIADLHALNSVHDRKLVKKWSYEIAATFLSLGLNTEKTVFFRQSEVPEVYQLSLLLTNVTSKGLMNRAHAYKASVDKNEASGKDPDEGINMGLYIYPILMASDILLYQTDLVPVGQDQKQHVEFARDIAGSFNHIYGREILSIPKSVIPETTNSIPGLDGRKMSKSYNNYIPIFAEANKLKKMVMKIVTDSKLPEEPKDPEESTIYQLYQVFASKDDIEEMRQGFIQGGMSYGEAKNRLYNAINHTISDARIKYNDLLSRPKDIDHILFKGANKARKSAYKTLEKVSKAMLGTSVVSSCK